MYSSAHAEVSQYDRRGGDGSCCGCASKHTWAEHLSGKALDPEAAAASASAEQCLAVAAAAASDTAAAAVTAQAAAAIGQGFSVASLQVVPGLCLLTMLLTDTASSSDGRACRPSMTGQLCRYPLHSSVLSLSSIMAPGNRVASHSNSCMHMSRNACCMAYARSAATQTNDNITCCAETPAAARATVICS